MITLGLFPSAKYIKVLQILGLCFLMGCSSTRVQSETRGNGQEHHKIQCRDTVASCYEKAEDLCPDGYLVLNRIRGIKRDGYTEFNLSIRCRGSKIFY